MNGRRYHTDRVSLGEVDLEWLDAPPTETRAAGSLAFVRTPPSTYLSRGGGVWELQWSATANVGYGVSFLAWVDGTTAAPAALQDGSLQYPYATIQAAIDAIPAPTSLAEQKKRYTVVITSGVYDEDLTVPAGLRVTLVPLGPVTLGDGAVNADYGSTVPRSVTVDCTPAFGGRSVFVIGTINGAALHGGNCTQATAFDISGDLNLTGAPTVPEAATVRLYTTRIRGALSTAGITALGVDFHGAHVRVDGAFGSNAFLVVQDATQINWRGLVTALFLGHVSNCEFAAGATVSQSPDFAGFVTLPPGMYSTAFAGTFTGPAGSCWLDFASNYWFKTNAAVLAGGATKTLLGDTVA